LNVIDESRSCGSSKNQDKKRNRETEFSKSEINNKGSNGAGRSTKRKLDEAIKDEKSPSDESNSEEKENEKENDENGSGDKFRSSESDESSSDKSREDSSEGEGSKDTSSEPEEDESAEKGFDGTKSRTCGSSSGYAQDEIEIIDVDDYWINHKGSKGASSSTKRELHEAKPVEKSLVDESEEEQSNEKGSGVRSRSIDLEESSVDVSTEDGSDGEGTYTAAVAENEKKECYGSAIPFKSGTDSYFGYDTIESDSDGSGWNNYFPPNHPLANKQSPTSNKTEPFSGSEQDTESESIQSDDSDYLLPKEVPKVRTGKEKVRSTNRKEKGRSVKKEMDDLID
ncbi:hypothetical protein Tco_0943508, partial [Tanacetum coccineum]